MTTDVIRLRCARREPTDEAWHEQRAREHFARQATLFGPPHRTRPLKVIDNDRARLERVYRAAIDAVHSSMEQGRCE